MFTLNLYIVLFFCYSALGYIMEVCKVSYSERRLILSRGYLIGPYLPIYGSGALLIILLLRYYENEVIFLWFASAIICCLLEYVVSYVMEKIFELRWWDYSNRKYNLHGRICLENGILFGIGGVFLVRFINPFFLQILSAFSNNVIVFLGFFDFTILVCDFLFSTYIILRLKSNFYYMAKRDSIIIIKKEKRKLLKKYRMFHRRLLEAFPYIKKQKNFLNFKGLNWILKKKK